MSGMPPEPQDRLRLVWSRPDDARPAGSRSRDLARAIEGHLAGQDGLTDEQFVVLYATGRPLLTVTESPTRF